MPIKSPKTIGILALQGAFAEYAAMLDRLGAAHFEIRQRRDLSRPLDGLILYESQTERLWASVGKVFTPKMIFLDI